MQVDRGALTGYLGCHRAPQPAAWHPENSPCLLQEWEAKLPRLLGCTHRFGKWTFQTRHLSGIHLQMGIPEPQKGQMTPFKWLVFKQLQCPGS